MMAPLRLLLLLCLAILTAAKSNADSSIMVIHESRAQIPPGFEDSGPASQDTILTFRAGLTPANIAALERELMAVSDPTSPRYGKHLTKEQVESFTKPRPESISMVTDWLLGNGIIAKPSNQANDWLTFSVPVIVANKLLDAEFRLFTHLETGHKQVRTISYSIPEYLTDHLNLIHPTITLSIPAMHRANESRLRSSNLTERAVSKSCKTSITPTCLQSLYNIPSTEATQSSNVIGVSGFNSEWASTADLQTFLQDFRSDLSSETTFKVQSVDGGANNENSPGLEGNLDIQYTVGLASKVPTSFISVGESGNDGTLADQLLDFVDFLLAESNPPQTLTTSYGINEDTISSALAIQICNAFMQLGARGTSVIFSSGDAGVAGAHGVVCTDFVASFPSTCPYVTSVGATTGTTETAADFSAGGFSNIFVRPSYQNTAVNTYLGVLGSTYMGLYNASGRGYPDVSAQGENFLVVKQGSAQTTSGTSCSAPTFASVIALLNDRLIAAGKSPLGFLNPFIYANPDALNDITTGENPGCNVNGFSAETGWDPVTGLGTPDFNQFLVATGLKK